MALQIFIPILITVSVAAAVYILLQAVGVPAGGRVEIIISGDEQTDAIENTVILAKQMSQRYFKNASVFIRGGDDTYVRALCHRYSIDRKE